MTYEEWEDKYRRDTGTEPPTYKDFFGEEEDPASVLLNRLFEDAGQYMSELLSEMLHDRG